ncbi:MAG: hypothetical protein E7001_00890 [Coriobacteriaceae bacterium]|nr:hypothetical protein [Coriobacteriaceae bacterium]
MASNLPEYTDLQRTRVIDRSELGGARSIGSTQLLKAEEQGLFEGLSVAQIIAGAAAAATSVLLASRLGVYGSVIGAAVSSVVTVIATQIYRRALTAGAKKLNTGLGAKGSPQVTSPLNNPYRTALEPGQRVRGARTAPASYRERAAAERRGVQRKVIIASVVVAVLAVAVTAGIILVSTAGEGLGSRPEPILTRRSDTAEDAAAGTGTAGDTGDAAADGGASTDAVDGGRDDAASSGDAGAGDAAGGGADAGAPGAGTGDQDASGTEGADTGAGNAADADSGNAPGESGATTGAASGDTASAKGTVEAGTRTQGAKTPA